MIPTIDDVDGVTCRAVKEYLKEKTGVDLTSYCTERGEKDFIVVFCESDEGTKELIKGLDEYVRQYGGRQLVKKKLVDSY